MATLLVAFAGLSESVSHSQTLPSLMLNQDPVALSLGLASVASEAGAYSIQNNVAAVSFLDESFDARIGMGIWQPSYADLLTMGGAAVYRFGKLGLAADFKLLKLPSYSGVTDSGLDIRDSQFGPKEISFAAGVSYAFIDCLSAGVSVRYVGSDLAEDASASVFGADVALYFNRNGFTAGLSVNNLGTKVKYQEASYAQPMVAKAGVGYKLGISRSSLDFTAQADVLFTGGIMAGAGCEYSYDDMVHARIGYHYGGAPDVLPSYASAGIGAEFFGVKVDAAYLFGSPVLANTFSLSLGYAF